MIHASGTPPTRVLTVSNPQLAASRMAMQNASVKELLKWISENTSKQEIPLKKSNRIYPFHKKNLTKLLILWLHLKKIIQLQIFSFIELCAVLLLLLLKLSAQFNLNLLPPVLTERIPKMGYMAPENDFDSKMEWKVSISAIKCSEVSMNSLNTKSKIIASGGNIIQALLAVGYYY